jgi:diguanylate cyclase (GGDEF)-like protein
VDNFKEVNDQYGHPMGDQVLKDVSRILKGCVREIDVCCRYGGDEFCILLPETDLHGAANLTKRIINTFHNQPMVSNLFSIKVTASFGIAELNQNTQTVDDLLSHADHALYKAKQNGRDRYEIWDDPLPAKRENHI